MQRVLVCGGRRYDDFQRVCVVLDEILRQLGVELLIHGDAGETDPVTGKVVGADRQAGLWARSRGVPVQSCPALWHVYGSPAAGPIRNGQMIIDHHPTLVIGFPGRNGTANMLRQARFAHIPTVDLSTLPH